MEIVTHSYIRHLESVIKHKEFSTLNKSLQSTTKTLRLKFRVDIVWIRQKIENCPNRGLLNENSNDDVECG